MADFFLPVQGTTQNNPTHTPRAGHGAARRRRARAATPTVAEARRVAELAARLPGASATATARLRHVEAVALAAGWSDETVSALVWTATDWPAVWAALGRARGVTARQLGRLSPADLLEQIVEDDHEAGGAGRVA